MPTGYFKVEFVIEGKGEDVNAAFVKQAVLDALRARGVDPTPGTTMKVRKIARPKGAAPRWGRG